MIRIEEIEEIVSKNAPDADIAIIRRAYIYSAQAHQGQMRLSGEPYLIHPLEVAGILANMRLDPVSVAAGLLHDVIEDSFTTPEEIEEVFGHDVLRIVSGVTKLSKVSLKNVNENQTESLKIIKERHAESIRNMLLAMADDIRVILIKLADRLHNMRTLGFHKSKDKIRRIAEETLNIYAPIAARLGIYWIKKELEDIAFKFLEPLKYKDIESRLNKDKKEREEFIEKVKGLIKKKMKENSIECVVLGRYKNFYSIYEKMRQQNLAFEDVYDIIAFRIILDSIPHCYEALGHIHSMWQPIDIKFKDYIARPKPNMYRSLHTTVIGPMGERIEVQIRTYEMDAVAESGIAAHWSYKEGRSTDKDINKTFAWIHKLVKNQKYIKDPDEFIENVRIDLFPDEVYVFTPNGEVKTLPKGATPVDFAYLVHTEVGHNCYGAKVNGRMVPLKYELKTGDIVQILTKKNQHPSKDWLKFVATVKARSRIRQWIKVQEKDRSISLGREMCEKDFRKHKLSFSSLLKADSMTDAAKSFGFKTVDDLIADIGYGKITPLQLIKKVAPAPSAENPKEEEVPLETKNKKKRVKTGVLVKGADDILMKFGKCCNPVPGDEITGYITQGFGITVHRRDCINAINMNQERRIDVKWADKIEETYPVTVLVQSIDRLGLLADVAACISDNMANIVSANTLREDNGNVKSIFAIKVKSTSQLKKIILAITKVDGVINAVRETR